MKTVFLQTLTVENKRGALLEAIRETEPMKGTARFELEAEAFRSVPRSPFAYWVSAIFRRIFLSNEPLQASGREASSGATTNDDPRFLRLWFEVHEELTARQRDETFQKRWCSLAKGGEHSRFFADPHLVIDWQYDGLSIKSHIAEYRGRRGWGYQWSAALNGHSNYFRAGLTWSRRSQKGLSLRALPAGGLFGDKGPAVFVPGNDNQLLHLLAVTNSRPFRELVATQMAFGSYEVGVLERTPLPPEGDQFSLASLAYHAWSLKRSLDTCTETSHAFTLPALLQVGGEALAARADGWTERVRLVEAELAAIQAEIDERCFDLYGIDEDDRRSITRGFGAHESGETDTESEADADDEDEAETNADTTTLTAELVSWAIGVAFGRFDVRLATGVRALPPEPEPFDPLPVCSPGMLTGADGLPLSIAPADYPITFPKSGILVDDSGHPHDLTAAVRTALEAVFGTQADAIWEEAASLLDPKGHDLRKWLASSFFEHHLKRHSKSRRKAPILWQLGVSSGRYSVWLYAHRLTLDSLFQIQNDVVGPKLAHEQRQLASLEQDAGPNPSAAERKQIASQEAFVAELRALLDEVKRVAPLWNPNLDDGVVLTMAPLWRLVSQHKPWQRELKAKCDELAAGDYDWTHLAMHLWPERVVPKCASDRSFAIAHTLEDVFWAENADGKWEQRPTPARPVEDIVAERTSAAVKAALASLLEAPVAGSGGRLSRARTKVSARGA